MAKIVCKGIFNLPLVMISLLVLFIACSEKELTPDEIAEKYKSDIVKSAPIHFEYDLITPSDNIPDVLREFSGHWIGRWDEKEASQLIITKINKNEANFIFSWEGNNTDDNGGAISQTALVKPNGRIVYTDGNESLTFAVDTLLNKVIGVHIIEDDVSNIVMQKIN